MAQRHLFILKQANAFLHEYDCSFICHAINKAMKHSYTQASIDAGNEIKSYIEECIYPHKTVGEWLQEQGYNYKYSDHPESITYRQRWIQHMIDNHEEFFGKD